MATVNFLFRSTKDKAPLILRLLFRHNDKDHVLGAKTQLDVSKYYWTKERPQKRPKDVGVSNRQQDINAELNKIENHILNVFNSIDPAEVSKDWLQLQINNYYNPPKEDAALPTELIKYFDYFITTKKNEVMNSTYKKYNVIKSLLERYQKTKKDKIYISDVNENFKNDFETYCLKENYAINTISKSVRSIKAVCNHAKYNGIKTSYQLEKIRTNQQKTEKIFLTFDDLTKIENIDNRRLNDNTDNAKDWLIISCYTGQRVSDFMRFNKSMIRYELNDIGDLEPFIEFKQVKTNSDTTVPLHPKVMELLNKRDGNFPKIISDPKYNLFIKEVCRIAEIDEVIKGSVLKDLNKEDNAVKQFRKESGMFKKWELVTSHIGRRSFATNFYGTIPTTYLINITGHKTEVMFLNYLGKSNKDLAKETFKYFK